MFGFPTAYLLDCAHFGLHSGAGRGGQSRENIGSIFEFSRPFYRLFFNTIVECHGLCERLRYVVKKLRMDSQLTQDGRSSSFTGLFSV